MAKQKKLMREKLNTDRVETQYHPESTNHQTRDERCLLRSKYRAVVNKIHDKNDDLVKLDSNKFNTIIDEVETLFRQVRRPREQTADGEALLGLVNSLANSVNSHSRGGITPSDFVCCLLRDFGKSNTRLALRNSIRWKHIGHAVSPIFMKAHGCQTMIGPMSKELKKRKTTVNRKRMRPIVFARPMEFDDAPGEEKTDTDKNMLTMFDILKKKRRVVLENLILNRSSFAQTVENLFGLSFLVRDGRVEITVNADGSHLVSPKNSPDAASIASREVSYNHFVFRFDFNDWKSMRDVVPVGEELMPHRSIPDPMPPIRKISRNQGLQVKQEPSVVEECSVREYNEAMKRMSLVTVVKPKRKLRKG